MAEAKRVVMETIFILMSIIVMRSDLFCFMRKENSNTLYVLTSICLDMKIIIWIFFGRGLFFSRGEISPPRLGWTPKLFPCLCGPSLSFTGRFPLVRQAGTNYLCLMMRNHMTSANQWGRLGAEPFLLQDSTWLNYSGASRGLLATTIGVLLVRVTDCIEARMDRSPVEIVLANSYP